MQLDHYSKGHNMPMKYNIIKDNNNLVYTEFARCRD